MKYRNLEILWLGHAGFLIKSDINVYIDPFKLNRDDEKADLVLITHGHYDHCSVEDVKKIIKHGTKIIGPIDILSQTRQIEDGIDFDIASPGKTLEFKGIKIHCIESYNSDKRFHPKNEGWVGYVVDFKGTKIYHSGDSDLIPEMRNVKCDVALLPVGGKFTMNSNEAALAAGIIKPDLAIPMHWGSIVGSESDAKNFVSNCKLKGINAVVLEKFS